MADAEATALFKIKADASQAIKETTKLAEAQGKLGYSVKKAGVDWSKMIDGAAVGLAKFNLAVGGIEKGLSIINNLVDTAIDQSRLRRMESMLPVGVVDRFRNATDKLILRQDVLRISTKGLTGDFALTEPQMQKVLQASVALQEKGFGPATEVADKLLEALGPKGVDKLDDFGIALEKTKDKQHDLNEAMKSFDKIIDTNKIDEDTKNLYALKDALVGIGEEIKSVVAAAGRGIAWLVAQRSTSAGKQAREMAFGWLDYMGPQPKAGEDPLVAYNRQLSSEVGFDTSKNDPRKAPFGPPNDPQYGLTFAELEARREAKAKAKGGYRIKGEDIGERVIGDPNWTPVGEGDFGFAGFDSSALGFAEGYAGSRGDNYLNNQYDPNAGIDRLKGIKEQLGDTTTAAGAAYATLAGGITAAVDAAITGSDSIGKAAAKASAQILKSLAIEATGRAVYEGALAIGSLAMGDARGASMHGLAAAKFAAAAAGLGVLSAGLNAAASGGGGSAGGASAAPGGGFASSRGGSGGGEGGQTIVVNFGDGFVGDHDKVVDFIAKAVRTSERNGRSRPASSFSSGFSG